MKFFVLALPLFLSALVMAPAEASDARGGPLGWPQYRITYKITNPKVARVGHWVARAWNQAQVRYKFVPVSKRSEANVLIRKYHTCGAGLANIGYISEAPSIAQISSCSSPYDRGIATHELGHILGLGHYGKCQLMSEVLCPGTSPRPSRKEKRLVRKMARARDAEVARAPKQPSIQILEPTLEEYDEVIMLDMRVRMSASFQDRFWQVPVVSGKGVVCYEGSEWEEGEYGPWGWGWNSSWRVDDYISCEIENPEGAYTIRASNKSYLGTEVEDEWTFSYP